MKVVLSDTDYNAETILDESFKQTEEREFELEPGNSNL